MKAPPVDGLLLVRLTQRDAEERPDVNPVPKGTRVRYERQQINEEIVCEVVLYFLLEVPVP